MRFSLVSAALVLAASVSADYSVSDSTTTLTSTATLTRTITVSSVVASVTSTYPAHNATLPGPTAVGTASSYTTASLSSSPTGAATPAPSHFNAASSLNGMYAGGAGVLVMIAAAFL